MTSDATAGRLAAPRGDRTVAWAALQGHGQAHGTTLDLREAFDRDPRRFERLSFEAPEVFADLSRQPLDETALRLLVELAVECRLPERRDALLAGAVANVTEGRAVLHTALRAPRGAGAPFEDEVHGVLDALLDFAERVRADERFTDVVNIGIGGSDLGPAMAVRALQPWQHRRLRVHFVSNVDGHDIAPLLARLDPARTLFVVASKTFTTQETMANAQLARQWFGLSGGTDVARHFVATTTHVRAAADFGITTTFGFRDWVGGRYSLWSAIGLPIALAVGAERFRDLLAGAHAMDRHFAEAPPGRNLPMLLGLLDVWQRNVLGHGSRCIAPYHQGLARLPAYLQQLEMESNGKRVDEAGEALPFHTAPVVWGEPGTNGQHAYFQMLHQGTEVVPVEFILVRRPLHAAGALPVALDAALQSQHDKLLANGLAQARALMTGRSAAAAAADAPAGAAVPADVLARHRTFPGNRPSTTLLLEQLTPRALGALVALYEHRVWTSGAVWGIDSFDQWGVELGKAMAGELLPHLQGGAAAAAADAAGLDPATRGWLARLRG